MILYDDFYHDVLATYLFLILRLFLCALMLVPSRFEKGKDVRRINQSGTTILH